MWNNSLVVVVLLTSTFFLGIKGANVTVITALANASVSLPCDISTPNVHGRVTFILWYREDLGIPIYSYEVDPNEIITSSQGSSIIWSDEKWLGARALFRPETFPATLQVMNVQGSDAGQYRCRVDFTDAPTRNTLVNLTVIVPPDPVVIFDETGKRRASVVGPYLVGDKIHLVCDAFGGNPLPRLTWYKSGSLIDETYDILSNGTVRNEITFHSIERSFLRTKLTCEASNTNLTRPTSTTVNVDMNFAPVTVNIVNKVDQLVVGRESEIVCRSTGSRPPAHITWYLGGQRLEGGGTESASSDGNATVSILTFRPRIEHIGMDLSCKATNPLISESELFDNMQLRIDYAPRVDLTLGKSISPGSIYEGGDVYFDCLVIASPKPYKILWFQDERPLLHNTGEGVILTNRSLVLQGIDRTRSGGYTCQAINAVGSGQSQAIELDVKYVPVCLNSEPIVHGVGKGEMVDVICDVVANPNVEAFHWAFNNSAGLIHVPASRSVSVNGTRSKLTYTPKNNKDYGTLMCGAKNEVGKQKHPCIFHIILAVAPEPVANCTTINPSAEHFRLSCKPGFDGGMEQFFEVVVRESNSGALVFNVTTTDIEKLDIDNLNAGLSYIATVTPRNKKGPGKSINFEFDTIMHPKVEVTQVEDAASAAASGSSENDSIKDHLQDDFSVMVIGILTGGLIAFSLLAFVGFMARRCVHRHRNTTTAMMCSNVNRANGSLEAINNSSGQAKAILPQQSTEVVVPRNIGDGSLVGATVLHPLPQQQGQISSSSLNNHQTRKGILKRSQLNNAAANNWTDYELSSSNNLLLDDVDHHHHHHHHQQGGGQQNGGHRQMDPDIVPSGLPPLPIGLPPPPEGGSGGLPPPPPPGSAPEEAVSEDCELCMTSTSNPPLEAPAGFSPQHQHHHNKDSRLQPLMKPQQPPLVFLGSSRTLPRRTSKEGLLVNEMDGGTFENSGSTDPLLQIPSQLSAVLTLKRGNSGGGGTRESPRSRNLQVKTSSTDNSNRTPLLKRKRESIV